MLMRVSSASQSRYFRATGESGIGLLAKIRVCNQMPMVADFSVKSQIYSRRPRKAQAAAPPQNLTLDCPSDAYAMEFDFCAPSRHCWSSCFCCFAQKWPADKLTAPAEALVSRF
jgi:hypothetical protein